MPSIDDLRTQFKTAQAATQAYSDEITAKYRAEYPEPADWRGPGPHPETAIARAKAETEDERAELDRLRVEARRLAVEIDRARQAGGHDAGA